MISYAVIILMRIISFIIVVACLLSWFPMLNKHKEPIATINRIFYALVAPFRFIPPIGMIDISPIVAFLVYTFIGRLLVYNLMRFGL